MTRTSDRRPTVYSRVEPDEMSEYQRLADQHYDGNLSLFVRLALRKFAATLKQQGAEQKGRAA